MAVLLGLSQYVGLFFTRKNTTYFIIVIVSLVFAVHSAMLSRSRGFWIGFLAGVPLGVFLLRKTFVTKKLIGIVVLAFLMIVFAGTIASKVFIQRWEATLNYAAIHNTKKAKRTGIGARILLQQAAMQMWKQNPIIGSGIGDYRHDFAEMVKNNLISVPKLSKNPIFMHTASYLKPSPDRAYSDSCR